LRIHAFLDCGCELGLSAFESVAGLISGCVALMTNALHNTKDAGALFIAYIVRKISKKGADEKFTFGYNRAELIGAMIQFAAFIIVGLYLVYEATRRAIALIVIISAITLQILLPVFIPNITIVIGYYDTARGLWPWSSTYQTINWIAIDSGLRPIVISPITNNILITIIGMFFGNQITKR